MGLEEGPLSPTEIISSLEYESDTEPALVSVLDSYSEDEEISVCDSGPSSSPTYTITDYLSGYCPKKNVNDFVLRRTFYSRQLF